MYTYHPASWSEQARELSNRIAANVNSGAWCFEQAQRFWSMSYRHSLIVGRAAKRFGRMRRAGKIKESPAAVAAWAAFKAERELEYYENLTGEYLEY